MRMLFFFFDLKKLLMTLVYPMFSISDMGFAQDRLVSRVAIQISKIHSIYL
jgi:hypothetical protein